MDQNEPTQPSRELLRARMTLVAQEFLLDWLVDSHRFLLSLSSAEATSRSLAAMRDALQRSRQDQTDMLDQNLPPDQARLQAAMFREAFDEAAVLIETRLGLPTR